MLYQSTCVGLGYGLYRGSYFLEDRRSPPNPIRVDNTRSPSLPTGPGILTRVSIDYAFRPRLRGRLTLRGLTLRRNPWTYGDSVSRTVCRYSCQHSHFRYLQHPSRRCLHRPTERSATAQKSDIRDQKSGRGQIADQTLKHLGNLVILVTPTLPDTLLNISKIKAIPAPDPHLISRTNRYHKKALVLGIRLPLLAKPLGDVHRNRLASPTKLIAQRPLLDLREFRLIR